MQSEARIAYSIRVHSTGPQAGVGGGAAEHWTQGVEESAMAYVISDDCTMCGSCKAICPVEAIREGDPKYVIDADTCVDCGQCVDECPSESISPVE